MSKPTIRPATLADCISLAPRLRVEDALELRLSSGTNVLQTLFDSFAFSSECFVAEEDGLVIAIGGFGTVIHKGPKKETTVGVPWLVGSPEVLRHPVTLVAVGRVAVDRWSKHCECMCNLTHIDNHAHHKWLKHIGFEFMPDVVPTGASKAPFLQFYRYS